jgi:hypothetical protein
MEFKSVYCKAALFVHVKRDRRFFPRRIKGIPEKNRLSLFFWNESEVRL